MKRWNTFENISDWQVQFRSDHSIWIVAMRYSESATANAKSKVIRLRQTGNVVVFAVAIIAKAIRLGPINSSGLLMLKDPKYSSVLRRGRSRGHEESSPTPRHVFEEAKQSVQTDMDAAGSSPAPQHPAVFHCILQVRYR